MNNGSFNGIQLLAWAGLLFLCGIILAILSMIFSDNTPLRKWAGRVLLASAIALLVSFYLCSTRGIF